MVGMKLCDKCGYRHGRGHCCIDVYQQLGQAKGPSVVGKVLLAFVFPIVIFIGAIILAEYLLSGLMTEGGMKTFISFLAALIVTVVLVQLIRVFTRKPINIEDKDNT